MQLRFHTIDQSMITLCRALTGTGSTRTERRGQQMAELGPVMIQLVRPRQRVCTLPERRLDPWVSLCEFPWLMAGRNDVAWLKPYLPRAGDFVDDGLTWRAGYGPRLRKWFGMMTMTDQLAECVARLHADPNTRQAVLSLWDPESDNEAGLKDYPCSNWLHFIRDEFGALNLHVVMRSNDLWWGYSAVNVINFTLLLELVAECLGWPVGSYYHTASNLHLYLGRHGDQARELGANNSYAGLREFAPMRLTGLRGETPMIRLAEFTRDCHAALAFVEASRAGEPFVGPAILEVNPWLATWAKFMLLHKGAPTTDTRRLLWLDDVPADWRQAMRVERAAEAVT